MTPARRWRVERRRASAADLHAESAAATSAPSPGRSVSLLEARRPALVLGSGQPDGDVDFAAAARAGVDVARRRSGGGAVLVSPDSVVWVDLVLPAGDPLWDGDVGRAAWWVGETWASALGALGTGGVEVWKGPMARSRWSSRVCFAGVGAGEVLVGAIKTVGVSQRRTRHAALFQTAALLNWDPGPLVDLLALSEAQRNEARSELPGMARGVGGRAAELFDAFVAALPG